MPGLLWIVEAVATGSKSVITKSMARWLQPWPENFGVKTAARKLPPGNCKRSFHFDGYSLLRMVFTYLVLPRP